LNEETGLPETKEELDKQIADAVRKGQEAQLQADEMRTYGNAFFAESLDHIGTLATKELFWRRVYQYGTLFRKQFEMNTGQAQPEKPPEKEPEKKPDK